MANLNKVMLIGNAGKDAELRYMASGAAQSTFSLAVNSNRKNKAGEWETETEWFSIVLWGDTAERVSQFITKGKSVYVEGRLQTRTWEDDAGTKHYKTEVVGQSVQLLDRKAQDEQRGGYERDTDVDDLPFE